MNKIIRSNIKPDKNKPGSQIVISVKEEDIYIAINQTGAEVSQVNLTFNQLCTLSKTIHRAIDQHYQAYSNSMVKEKTAKIYIDDPIDW
jgi:hypothetical protein